MVQESDRTVVRSVDRHDLGSLLFELPAGRRQPAELLVGFGASRAAAAGQGRRDRHEQTPRNPPPHSHTSASLIRSPGNNCGSNTSSPLGRDSSAYPAAASLSSRTNLACGSTIQYHGTPSLA